MAENSETKSRSIRPLMVLVPYIMRYRGMVAGALIFLTLAAATTLGLPAAVRQMVDHGFKGQDAGSINTTFGLVVIMAVVLAVSSALRYYFVITIGERIVSDLRRDVFAHVITLSPSFFDVNQSGEIVSRLTADTTQIKSVVGATASMALRNTILCLGGVVMMVVTSPKLSGLVLLTLPFIVFPLVAFGRSVRARSRAAQDTLADASAFAGETIAASRTVQAFTGEEAANRRYAGAVEEAYQAARAAIKSRSFLTGFAIALVFGSVVGVLWYGAHSVLDGTLSGGTLGQFLLYSVIAGGSLGALSEVWGEFAQASGAAERLSELLAEVPQIRAPEKPKGISKPVSGSLEFRDVRFAYPSRPGKDIVSGLSFTIAPGETVAIVGPSGAGKSTVFSLALRFYDPAGGTVLFDGQNVRDLDPGELRRQIAIVPQDVSMFSGSIEDNIAFGSRNASREAVVAAAHAAQAEEFINRLEQGYATQVGERGVTLSGGQRQRVAIARAILKNAPVLLLDEATSALDAESETLVQKALDGLMQGRTTIVIAHRLATVLKADRILVMDQGRIVEEGNHESLIRRQGLYAKLARLQFDQGARAFEAEGI